MQLSRNFTLREFTKSQTALRKGIDNTPTEGIINNLQRLCVNTLQPLRDRVGSPVVINSGFRSYRLNLEIGGSANSQHCVGLAADIECPGVSTYELAWLIYNHLPFDQLILEAHDRKHKNSGWVHVSLSAPEWNRGEFLGWNRADGYWRMA